MLRAPRRISRASRWRPIRRSTPGISPNWTPTTARCRRKTRFDLSVAAFNRVAYYDACISNYLSVDARHDGTQRAVPGAEQRQLRQGDGPALRREPAPAGARSTATCTRCRARWRPSQQLQGKELSYNNIADSRRGVGMRAPVRRAGLRDRQACQSLRRGRRRGLRRCLRARLRHRPDLARSAASSRSTRTLDAATAKVILDRQFVEVLIAPDYETTRWPTRRRRPTCACCASRMATAATASSTSSASAPAC